MAITILSARQEPIVAKATFALADLTSGTAVRAINLPAGARVLHTTLRFDTAFNSGTSDAFLVQTSEDTPKVFITIGAASGALAASKVWSEDADADGAASSNVAYKFSTPVGIDVKWTGVGTAATTGDGILIVEYIVENRAEHTYK